MKNLSRSQSLRPESSNNNNNNHQASDQPISLTICGRLSEDNVANNHATTTTTTTTRQTQANNYNSNNNSSNSNRLSSGTSLCSMADSDKRQKNKLQAPYCRREHRIVGVTHVSLFICSVIVVCLCIQLINLEAASISSSSSKSNTKQRHPSKMNFIKSHKPSSSSPITYITIKRAVPVSKPIIESSSSSPVLSSLLIPSSHASTDTASLSSSQAAAASVSKQLAATLISAAASSLAQTATESIIKAATSSKSHTRRPSKIYNLPVKFAANGQPNHIVTGIKQHLASIKKNSGNKKRNKLSKAPVFKHNSKFIYLPLKYLSNAKPYQAIMKSDQY